MNNSSTLERCVQLEEAMLQLSSHLRLNGGRYSCERERLLLNKFREIIENVYIER